MTTKHQVEKQNEAAVIQERAKGAEFSVRGFIVGDKASCNIYHGEKLFCSLERSYHRTLDEDANKIAKALNRDHLFKLLTVELENLYISWGSHLTEGKQDTLRNLLFSAKESL